MAKLEDLLRRRKGARLCGVCVVASAWTKLDLAFDLS